MSMHPSVCLSIRLSVYPSVCPSIRLFLHMSVCLSVVCPSIHLSVHLSVHLPVHPSVCLSIGYNTFAYKQIVSEVLASLKLFFPTCQLIAISHLHYISCPLEQIKRYNFIYFLISQLDSPCSPRSPRRSYCLLHSTRSSRLSTRTNKPTQWPSGLRQGPTQHNSRCHSNTYTPNSHT